MRNLPEAHVDAFSTGYRDLPSVATEIRRWSERVRGERNGAPIDSRVVVEPQKSLGLATSAQKAEVTRLTGADLSDGHFDFTVDTSTVNHIFRRHTNEKIETSRGQYPVTPDDFGRLGAVLNAPDSVTAADTVPGRGTMLRYEKRFSHGRIVAIFELRPGRRRLSLATMWVER